jgi:hypothetical protein
MNDAHGLHTAVTSLRHHDQVHVQQNRCLLTQFSSMVYRNKKKSDILTIPVQIMCQPLFTKT